MCGIIYAKNLKDKTPVNSLIKLMYLNQKARGMQGYGFVGLDKHNVATHRALDEKDLLAQLEANVYDEILLHHRLPTSTKNTLPGTHPFVVCIDRRRLYFTHNGIVWNDDELRARHGKQGITYQSIEKGTSKSNDSEALAWEFALYLTKRKTTIDALGTAAFICLETDRETNKATRLYFYRDESSELRFYRDKAMVILSSEGKWGATVTANRLYYYDYQSRNCMNAGEFRIASPFGQSRIEPHSYFPYRTYGYDTDTRDELIHLTAERDHLIVTGNYQRATELDDEIWFLEHQGQYLD